MDIQELLNNLHQDLCCSVCLNTFTDPKQLLCLHCFCLQCLHEIQRKSNHHDIITCPECRREVTVPSSGNLGDLQPNVRVSNMLNVLAIKGCNTLDVKCGNCDKKSLQCFYCFQCCMFWCEDCVIAHSTIRANKEHRLLAVKDFRDHDIGDVVRRPVFCHQKDHEKEELTFFCKDCEGAICNICVVTVHNHHTKMLLEDAVDEQKSELVALIKSQKKKVGEKRNKINKLEESSSKLQKKVSTVKQNVRTFADNMIAVIEAKRQQTFEEVDKHAREQLDCFKRQQCCMERQVKLIEKDIEETEELLKGSTSAEILQFKSRDVCETESEHDDDLEVFCCFSLEENKTLMDAAKTDGIVSVKTFLTQTSPDKSIAEGKGISEAIVGLNAQFVLTTRNAKGEQCYTERDRIRVEITNCESHDSVTTAQIHDNKDGTYHISHFFKQIGKYETSVTVNGDHVCGSPFAVDVQPRRFMPVLLFEKQDLSKPWGIAVNAQNEIGVTETGTNSVQVFSCDGTYLRSFGRKGNKEGEFNYPTGIAFDSRGNILVVDSFNHRVQLFSDHGNYRGQFGGEGNLDHQLKYPYGLSVDSAGNIIVADSGNKLVKFFSPSGHFLNKIGGECSLTKPFNCVQDGKFFLVSDISEHCIKVFDRKGHFLYKMGKKGQRDGEFNEPHVSVYKAGELIICDSLNHRVQIIKQSQFGTFVTKFGAKGHKLGKFQRPTSSAVLHDSKIALTDCFNGRIQIFSE